MKIYSWNSYCYNRDIPAVCRFIEKLDFDVLCLQEVTPELLMFLKQMPCHITYHLDVLRLVSKHKQEMNYVVILSRHEIHGHGTLQFPELKAPFQTRLFIGFMSIFKWTWLTERGAVYADIRFDGKLLRIFSVHLTLWGPSTRTKEFEQLMEQVPKETTSVICGDFNIIDYGPMKIMSWLLGAPIREGVPWYPERRLFEKRFKQYGFYNPLRGKMTHKFSRSQLDHILIADGLTVKRAWVEKKSYGSDHQPVGVELDSTSVKN